VERLWREMAAPVRHEGRGAVTTVGKGHGFWPVGNNRAGLLVETLAEWPKRAVSALINICTSLKYDPLFCCLSKLNLLVSNDARMEIEEKINKACQAHRGGFHWGDRTAESPSGRGVGLLLLWWSAEKESAPNKIGRRRSKGAEDGSGKGRCRRLTEGGRKVYGRWTEGEPKVDRRRTLSQGFNRHPISPLRIRWIKSWIRN
jgi:hypothetical protein